MAAEVSGEGVFFDTSVLVAATVDLGASSEPANTILAAVLDGRVARPQTAWHCCLELYSVLTRLPPELRVRPADALRVVRENVVARFEIHGLSEGERLPFLERAASDRIAGGRVYDAHIAEVALAAGAVVVITDNTRHFQGLRRTDVRVLTTAEFAAEI
ncbi:MAG TPA: PIN domain-containing protein [Myxococcota bacterium]|nr:PIN domain-containing protein [Myxococcota bacterium]